MLTLALILFLMVVSFAVGYYIPNRHMLRLINWKNALFASFGGSTPAVLRGRYLEIPYTYKNVRYIAYLPYHSGKAVKMPKLAIERQGVVTDLHHQPGLLFYCTPRMLGGEVHVVDSNNVAVYTENNIPDL